MNRLDAAIFSKRKLYVDREFEFILNQIYHCCNLMLLECSEIENNENKIRNRLYRDYLQKASVKEKLGLESFIFHPEVPEIDHEFNESSRTDLIVYNAVNYLRNEKAYYIIECKRLDGSKTLNDKYYSNGVQRFIDGRYPSNNKVNAMLAFIVKNIKINDNSAKIPGLISHGFIPKHDFCYTSTHTNKNSFNFTLYHLMFDFSMIVKLKPKKSSEATVKH